MKNLLTAYTRLLLSLILCAVCATPLAAQNIAKPWEQESWDANPQILALQEIEGRVFAGTNHAGVFYSDNNGDSWTSLRAVLPIRRAAGFLATESALFVASTEGMFRSTDRGNSWTASPAAPGSSLSGIKSMAQIGSSLFAVNSFSFYRSDDGGISWQSLILTGKPQEPIDIMAVHNGQLYLVVGSTNFLLNLETLSLQNISTPVSKIKSMFKSVNGRLYQAGFSSSDGEALFRLNDAGDEWENVGNNLPNGITVFDMLVNAGTFYLSTSSGLFTSSDAENWQAVPNSMDVRFYQNSTLSNEFILLGTFGDGVHRFQFNDPQSDFSRANTDLNSWTAGRIWRTTDRLIVESLGLGTRDKDPETDDRWTEITTDNPDPNLFTSEILELNDEWLMAAKYLYSSADGGRSWQLIAPISEQEFVQQLVIVQGNLVGCSFQNVIEYAADKSITVHDLPVPGGFSAVVAQGNTIFGAVNGGQLFQSQDLGRSWQAIGTGLPNQQIQHMLANSELIFAVSHSGAYQSLDAGVTWTGVNTQGLGFTSDVRDVIAYEGYIYVLKPDAILFSDESFSSWTKLSMDGLAADVRLNSIEIHDGHIYVGTYGDGMFSTTLANTISRVNDETLNVHDLHISPNPVKQTAQIHFTLQQAAHITVSVIDMRGNSVLSPIRRFRNAGSHSQAVGTEDLAAGQYFLIVDSNRGVLTQAFAVVR